jgi:hypothetical protein
MVLIWSKSQYGGQRVSLLPNAAVSMLMPDTRPSRHP